jgi:hypothetical protein
MPSVMWIRQDTCVHHQSLNCKEGNPTLAKGTLKKHTLLPIWTCEIVKRWKQKGGSKQGAQSYPNRTSLSPWRTSRRLPTPDKSIVLVTMTSTIFDEEWRTAPAEFTGMFEQELSFVSVHFLKDDNVVGVALFIVLVFHLLRWIRSRNLHRTPKAIQSTLESRHQRGCGAPWCMSA